MQDRYFPEVSDTLGADFYKRGTCFKNAYSIQSADLAALMDAGRRITLIDCRSMMSFNAKHVKGAANTLTLFALRRVVKKSQADNNVPLDRIISCDAIKETLSKNPETINTVVLYDDSTTDPAAGMSETLDLVFSYLCTSSVPLLWVHGGFAAFDALYPDKSEACRCPAAVQQSKFTLHTPQSAPVPTPNRSMGQSALAAGTPPAMILSYLYLGNQEHSADKQLLDSLKIHNVLNVAKECPNVFDAQLRYKKCELSDTFAQNIREAFDAAFQFIDEVKASGGRVLVHCVGGVSRSVTVVIAYLISRYGLSLPESYAFVKDRRPGMSPNLNFMGQLVEYANSISADCVRAARVAELATAVTPTNSSSSSSSSSASSSSSSSSLSVPASSSNESAPFSGPRSLSGVFTPASSGGESPVPQSSDEVPSLAKPAHPASFLDLVQQQQDALVAQAKYCLQRQLDLEAARRHSTPAGTALAPSQHQLDLESKQHALMAMRSHSGSGRVGMHLATPINLSAFGKSASSSSGGLSPIPSTPSPQAEPVFPLVPSSTAGPTPPQSQERYPPVAFALRLPKSFSLDCSSLPATPVASSSASSGSPYFQQREAKLAAGTHGQLAH
ncbi:dual specificity protein phosphatase 7 [Capsaspora owczarzaki ATCC 30864]|uniref:protein-tyrosine-phosphatase n=1 Tax=Capsaspora owczarzaki (strain ATCC 30864) TaxID=595528 RepID=A0A0D2WTA5_CAPO3|nr:dual specificity protein phosphatase 7 [Capsaspora owczarzaki ATCC 30864]KJE95610.1 dual specificity protein phosphatase 7 [Capsaspora owczarzaki ATCC 30864]|eukprot:XP_004345636.1 dual specificity protein phosphatase 7 [Capsaspora owczarzaki ATCC 30864]